MSKCLMGLLFFALLCNAEAYAREYDALGILNHGCEIGTGQVEAGLLSNNGTINVAFKNSGVICKGNFSMDPSTANHPFTVKGMRGLAELDCSNGATIKAFPVAEGIRKGHGRGMIEYPNKSADKFYFVFASKGQDTKRLLGDFLKREQSQCSIVIKKAEDQILQKNILSQMTPP